MTREGAERYIKSEMCKNCSVYLGGGKCFDNCKVIEAIETLEQESCSDAISRQKEDIAKAFQFGLGFGFGEKHDEMDKVIDDIKKAITPQQKIGHWIERESGTEDKEMGFETVIVCSYCDFPATTFYSEDCESRTQIRTHFCPNCGAKMQEVDNGDK